MPDIKKFPNIIEAMKYLEPGHLLTQCLEPGWCGDQLSEQYAGIDAGWKNCPSLSISES